ncbi:hypothetical protein J422_04528 [Methanocaldococcus villosus KIN24-T80]|uniref:ATP-grasp domain-containing protein n=1 Tax=Methanocaldococcus villosus KIN24-T80 TaxID=1069083 RepID=N6V1G2_9EURY|nr:tyramine--L-glutamate ligase [Methanocaldococcus villosus]ENN96103.1 hypothetical protein J422_04528 [Methanocaldococcus villosus KIN24-T80]
MFFEYALATGLEDEIIKEGKLMFNTLLYQFLKIDNVISFINKDYNDYKNEGLKVIETNDNNLMEKIREVIKNYKIDYFLVIAPEEDGILYKLTEFIERYGIKNLGSSSEAVKVAGDKYKTYLAIKDIVRTPKTIKGKYIIKKIDGCGGYHQLINENYIIQEYIEGESLSVSLIVGKKIYPLSLNRQYIDKKFVGADVNIDHNLKSEIFNEVVKAVKAIKGLNGYVGVDVVVNKNLIYIIEINPRITTCICKLNTYPTLAELLIKNANGEDLNFNVSGGSFRL